MRSTTSPSNLISTSRSAGLMAALVALSGGWGSLARADDVILTPDATTKGAIAGAVKGVVTAESPTKVDVKLGNNVTSVPTNEIVEINYDGHPASLDQAQAKEDAGSLVEAADLYKKAAADASSKPFVAEAALFGQARAMASLAEADPSKAAEAVALLDSFSRTYRNGRHVGPALEAQARLQIARNDYAGAEQTLASLAKLPKGDERTTAYRIKILTRKGQTDQAIVELDKMIAASPEGSTKRRDAQLAKAEALAATKKYDEAEALVRSIIKASGAEDASAQAAAHNALGACYRAAGRTKDALYAYLHTDVLFNKDKEQHARALGQIASLWRELKQNARADEVAERLKQDYPRSPEAREVH